MEEKNSELIVSDWFKQLTEIGLSLKGFNYFNSAPELSSDELFLLDEFHKILEDYLNDQSTDRLNEVLNKLKIFSLRTYAGYHHSSFLNSLNSDKEYVKNWTLYYVLLGQLKILQKKHSDVVSLIFSLSLGDIAKLKNHRYFIFLKRLNQSKENKIKDTVKIDYDELEGSSRLLKKAKQKLLEASRTQKLQNDQLKAHRLCNEIIEYFVDSDDQKSFKKKGMVITANLEDLNLIKKVSALITSKIECSLILKDEEGKFEELIQYIPPKTSWGSSRKIDTTKLKLNDSMKRRQALFDRIVREFTELKNKDKIMKNGLVIEARPSDYPLLLTIQDEISQIIKCDVYIREKSYTEAPSMGDTIVSVKF